MKTVEIKFCKGRVEGLKRREGDGGKGIKKHYTQVQTSYNKCDQFVHQKCINKINV